MNQYIWLPGSMPSLALVPALSSSTNVTGSTDAMLVSDCGTVSATIDETVRWIYTELAAAAR